RIACANPNKICPRKGSYEPNSRSVEEGRTRKSCLAGGRGGAATDPRYTHPSRNAGGDVRGCGHPGIFNSIYVRHAAGALRSDPLAAGRKDDAVFQFRRTRSGDGGIPNFALAPVSAAGEVSPEEASDKQLFAERGEVVCGGEPGSGDGQTTWTKGAAHRR